MTSAGSAGIAANSNRVGKVIFRFNPDNFDRVDMTLAFSDAKDARPFTATVAGNILMDVSLKHPSEHSIDPV
jgi:hypothetical protein